MSITLNHVSVHYGEKQALTNCTTTLETGKVTVIVGGDGAGKSTLLKILARYIRPSSGSIEGLTEARNIGYQSADSGTWANLSVASNMNFVGNVFGMDAKLKKRRIHELTQEAHLPNMSQSARDLSGGMRQKLGCIMASLHEPGLLLLDEPTTGVDPVSREELWELIDAQAQQGRTVIVATTYIEEAARGSSMILLDHGAIVAQGNARTVIANTPGMLLSTTMRKLNTHETVHLSMPTWRRGNTQYMWVKQPPITIPQEYTTAQMDIENACIIRMQLNAANHSVNATGRSWTPREATHMPILTTNHGMHTHKNERDISTHDVDNSQKAAMQRQKTPMHALGHDEKLVDAHAISKRFGKFHALSDVSICVESGEIVGLIGSNGAGKTTLMRVLLGLEQQDSGTAYLLGHRPDRQSRSAIGYVPQGLGLYPTLDAEQNLRFVHAMYETGQSCNLAKLRPKNMSLSNPGFPPKAGMHGRFEHAWPFQEPSSQAFRLALDYARSLGKQPVQELPLGTRRMLAYVIATAHDPCLLILDEPTSGVDPISRMDLWNHLHASADHGNAVLITTHYMSEAAQCDRCVLLSQGKVIASGTMDEIAANRSNPYINTLFTPLHTNLA